jgi:hypothetical protein
LSWANFRRACAVVAFALWIYPGSVSANPATDPPTKCPSSLANGIPARPASAPEGSDFAHTIATEASQQREAAVKEELLRGNVPHFLRELKPVTLTQTLADGRKVDATLCVMPDYLAVGDDRDYLRMPMNLHTAADVADGLGFVLPTRKMVDAIYRQADVHLRPQPMQPGPQMTSTDYFVRHNRSVTEQISAMNVPLGALISGNKKDVVLSNRLATRPDRIAIYGWHQPSGQPIQPLSTVHGAGYADYSHGIRLVSDTVYIEGKPASIRRVLQDPVLANLLSDEGPLRALSLLTR